MGTGREEQTHQAQRAMIHSEHNEEMKNEKRSTQNVIIHSIRVDACLTCGPRGKERWKKKTIWQPRTHCSVGMLKHTKNLVT